MDNPGRPDSCRSSPGYVPFHPNPSKPKFKPPAGAVDAHCHVFGPESEISLRAGAQIHALRRTEGEAVRAARLSRLRQERHRAGVLSRQGQPGDGRCARLPPTAAPRASPSSARRSTDAELRWMDAGRRARRALQFPQAAGRLHSARRVATHCRAGRKTRLAYRGLFRDAGLGRPGGFLHLAAHCRGGRSHGQARRDQGRRACGQPPLP